MVPVPAANNLADARTGRSLRWKYTCHIVDQLPRTLPRRSFQGPMCSYIDPDIILSTDSPLGVRYSDLASAFPA